MADLTNQGFNRGRGLKQPQVREDTLALGPSVDYYEDLLGLTDAQTREGQVRLALQEGNMYYRWNGTWRAISPLNLYGFRQVDVVEIDNPVEMAEEVPRGQEREIVVARQSDGAATVYRFDFGEPEAGASSPYAVRSNNANGFWSAMGGRYQSGGRAVLAGDSEDGIYVTGQGSEPSLWLGGLLQYDVPLTWDAGDPGGILSDHIPSISVPIIYDGTEYSLVLWTAAKEETQIPGPEPENSSVSVSLSSGALSSFSPLSISGIQLWIDAQDESTYTEIAGRLSEAQNKANGSKNLTQSSGASLRPLKVGDAFGARLTGVSYSSPTYMTGGSGWTGGTEVFVAMVFKNDRELNGAGTPDGLFSIALNSGSFFSVGTQDGGGAFTASMAAGDTQLITEGTPVPAGTVSIVYAYFSGATNTMTIFHNGASFSDEFSLDPAAISASAIMSVGRQWRSGSFTDLAEGDVGDIIYVNGNSALNSATIDNVVDYLKFKYGVSF